MSSPADHWLAFGLRFRSDLALPELPACAEPADVEIVAGPVPEALAEPGVAGVRYQAAAGQLLLRVDGVARYLVEQGRRITVDADPGSDPDAVRLFLLGPVVGALLHQRGDLLLHASAIVVGDRAIGFLGRSGIGKSTLAMEFRRRGYKVLTDDLCVVRPDAGGTMRAVPGFPQGKLWPESLRQLDLPAEGLARVRVELEKRAVPLGEDFASEPRPLERLYFLQTRIEDRIALEPAAGPLKFELLRQQTYRFRFVGGMQGGAAHMAGAAALARQARVTVARRPNHAFRLTELADAIEADW